MSRPSLLCKEPVELVGGNQPRPPRHHDGLEKRQHATIERRATDAECFGCLRPRVREPLNA
jgi:hypothetical protein